MEFPNKSQKSSNSFKPSSGAQKGGQILRPRIIQSISNLAFTRQMKRVKRDFKKMQIADNLDSSANTIQNNHHSDKLRTANQPTFPREGRTKRNKMGSESGFFKLEEESSNKNKKRQSSDFKEQSAYEGNRKESRNHKCFTLFSELVHQEKTKKKNQNLREKIDAKRKREMSKYRKSFKNYEDISVSCCKKL